MLLQAVQRIAGHMTTGVAQFPNIISIVPLQVNLVLGSFPRSVRVCPSFFIERVARVGTHQNCLRNGGGHHVRSRSRDLLHDCMSCSTEQRLPASTTCICAGGSPLRRLFLRQTRHWILLPVPSMRVSCGAGDWVAGARRTTW